MSIQQAFNAFMTDNDHTVFQDAVDLSTRAFWAGPGAGVELKPDGTYRVIELINLGTYKTPGIILVIPCLNKEDLGTDTSDRYYGNVKEQLDELFAEALERYESERALLRASKSIKLWGTNKQTFSQYQAYLDAQVTPEQTN